jgi:transcriptional regulator GlxA family with amidase domain
MSIKQVLLTVGYGEASNFDHDFKFILGKAPSDYRHDSTAKIG